MKIKRNTSKRTILTIAALAIVVAGVAAYGAYYLMVLREPSITAETTEDNAGDPSDSIQPQPDDRTDEGQAGVIDSGGGIETSEDGASSESGAITLYSPTPGSTLTANTSVEGAATVRRVHYRILDDVSGVIGQGSLTVTDGTFSGTLQSSTESSDGTIEFYSMDSSGREADHVEIEVRY